MPLKSCSGENLHQKPLNCLINYSITVMCNGQKKRYKSCGLWCSNLSLDLESRAYKTKITHSRSIKCSTCRSRKDKYTHTHTSLHIKYFTLWQHKSLMLCGQKKLQICILSAYKWKTCRAPNNVKCMSYWFINNKPLFKVQFIFGTQVTVSLE